jgi:hypothetical protein
MPRPFPSAQPQGLSTVLLAALAVGAAGFGFGSFFYAVPYRRTVAQLDKVQKELRSRPEPSARRHVDVEAEDVAARHQAEMKALKATIDEKLPAAGATVNIGTHRMLVSLPEDKIFEARGPWLSKSGQELVQQLGGLLAGHSHRVVISAPMGSGTVPRWIKAQLPTPADLSAARAGNALKSAVKGGVRADIVLAVVGALAAENGVEGAPTLNFEIEP